VPATTDHGTTRDGLIQFRRRWKPTGPARAAILLLHGISEHTGRYEHVGDQLAEAGFEVVGIDHRGYGQSGGRRAYLDHWSDFLDDVEDQLAELRALQLPTVMLGHSMGGLITLSYCLDGRPLPDLAVVSGPALGIGMSSRQRVFQLVGPALRRASPGFEIREDFDPTIFASDISVGERFRDDPLRVDFVTVAIAMELLGALEEANRKLDSLEVPTLCLHGSDDKLVPVGSSEPLATIGGADRIVYDGLGHEIFNEPNGREIVDEVIRWIDARLD